MKRDDAAPRSTTTISAMTTRVLRDGPFDNACHDRYSALSDTAFTRSPSVTNSCPTVMTVDAVGQARDPHAVRPVGKDLDRA